MTIRTSIIILGMHRSGTSALAGALAHAGVYAGPNLIQSNPIINAKGFWEHADIVTLHDLLLERLESVWSDTRDLPPCWWELESVFPLQEAIEEILARDFANQSLWVLKDPRMCRLLPMWDRIFKNLSVTPIYISMLRDPLEVAMSLTARDGMSQERASALWLLHVLDAELQIRQHGGVRITYSDLLQDWQGTLQKIALCLPQQPLDFNARSEAISGFLEFDLYRQRNDQIETIALEGLMAIAADLYKRLIFDANSISDAELTGIWSRVADYQSQHAELLNELAFLDAQTQRLQRDLAHANVELSGAKKELRRVKSSMSWQLTKPLRAIENGIRRLV